MEEGEESWQELIYMRGRDRFHSIALYIGLDLRSTGVDCFRYYSEAPNTFCALYKKLLYLSQGSGLCFVNQVYRRSSNVCYK